MRHYLINRDRAWYANLMIGMTGSPFGRVLGDPRILLGHMPLYTAKVIKFPERRSKLARLRAEVEEIRRSVRGGC
jgi:hypothetical protein